MIESLSRSGLVLLRADGAAVTVAVGPATRVQLRRPARVAGRPGPRPAGRRPPPGGAAGHRDPRLRAGAGAGRVARCRRAPSCWSRTRRASGRWCAPTSSARATAWSGPPAGAEALERIEPERVRLMVLDLGLPDLDGVEVCRRVRARSDVPIIMLTARDEETDRVLGLEVGADDYLAKPLLAARADGPDPRRAAPVRGAAAGRPAACAWATSSCAPGPGRSRSTAGRSSCGPRSSTCWPT